MMIRIMKRKYSKETQCDDNILQSVIVSHLLSDVQLEQHGGALFIQTLSIANITDCHFIDNEVADDGIYI